MVGEVGLEPTTSTVSEWRSNQSKLLAYLVGETGFEPATSSSQTKRSTRLNYSPIVLHAPLEYHQFHLLLVNIHRGGQ